MNHSKSISVVIPTIREENFKKFMEKWQVLFHRYNVHVVVVRDGDEPTVQSYGWQDKQYTVQDIMGVNASLIFNRTAACRNLGFFFAAKEHHSDVIITLDDDVYPHDNGRGLDPIAAHLQALDSNVPITWLSTAQHYMRGFPYGVREEAPVMLSHGVWVNVKDWDGPTQLVNGNVDTSFFEGPIPKGVFYPMSSMNLAFNLEALPYMYQAPTGPRTPGIHRFDDIWCGIMSKRAFDEKGWAVISGNSTVWHDRASNVFKNIQKEAKGLEYNEVFYKGLPAAVDFAREQNDQEMVDYFMMYLTYLQQWEEITKVLV